MSFLEYAPAPESRAILNLRDRYGLFIDGEFVDGRGTPFQTISPATEERIAEIANANEADVADAVAAARRAYDKVWGPMNELYESGRAAIPSWRDGTPAAAVANRKNELVVPEGRKP